MSTTRTALARLYRPRRFAEMATQEHVAETLKAAVARGRVAHAYLFCGPRGVGKTTAARVLAMALNCPNRAEDGEPCGTCESCERIWAGRTSLDVVEIDAASNRGVDDARELRERAMYAPSDQRGYKVYIVDEAHMLTREAWNALLKILEEPPPRVIFVFATTEPQRIQQAAPPILSRCQRFDFRRISVQAIANRLSMVAASEGIEADPEALTLIARRADGGLRDALSLLDQVLSLAGGRLTVEDVRRVLGLVDEELYLELFGILAERRHADVFRFVERLLDEGYDLAEFYRGLADMLRALLIAKLDGAQATEIREDLREAFAEQASRFSVGDLLRMLAQVAELDTEGRFRKSANPRILLEAMLLRFAHLDRTVELEALIRAAEGAPPPEPLAGPAIPRAARAPAESRPRVEGGGGGGDRREPRGVRGGEPPVGRPIAGAPARQGPESAPPEQAAAGTAGSAEEALRVVIRQGRGLPPGLASFLRAARVVEEDGSRVILELPPGPGLERLTSEPAARRSLEEALARQLGRPIVLEARAQGGGPAAPPRITPERLKEERLARIAREEPLLGQAIQEWDLELLD